MKTTIEKIQEIITNEKQATAKHLRERLGVSQVLVHRHLKKLCEREVIKKIGSTPKVFYIPTEKKTQSIPAKSKILEDNWLEIMPNGEFIFGEKGFLLWCQERNYDYEIRKKEFEKIYREKEQLKEQGLIDATEKLTMTFAKNYLEKVWYLDCYSWEIFGKTLLGKLILYAKQNSDIVLMKRIARRVQKTLLKTIARNSFDSIGIIPHSIKRRHDFLQTTLGFLDINPIPQKIFEKVFSQHAVAQKTLKSKQDRERNAEETLFLVEKNFPNKMLLIDDACGSGATLNIAAQKIRSVSPNTKVYGLTFVGSQKGFEVIAES